MEALQTAVAGPWNLFILLALGIGLAVAYRAGRRAGAPSLEWVALLALVVAAGLVGSRVLHFDPGAARGAKTILGAVLLGTVALFAGLRFLRLPARSLDALALALPLGFAVGRIGCLLAGCCFGHPTELPWGAVYDAHSAAFRAQLAAGLIGADAAAALPVHPTQLYEAMAALFAAGTVPLLRRRVAMPGSVLLGVIALLALARTALESFRSRDLASVAGLTQVQWLLLALALVTVAMVVRRERRGASTGSAFASAHPRSALRLALAALLPAVLLVAGNAMISPIERLILTLVAALPIASILGAIAATEARRQHAFASAGMLSGGALVLALQQPMLNRTEPQPPEGRQSAAPQSYWTVGLTGGGADRRVTVVTGEEMGDCGPFATTEDLDVSYRAGGAHIDRTTITGYRQSHTIRLRGFAGRERASSRQPGSSFPEHTTSIGGGGFTIAVDREWWGASAGAVAGRFTFDEDGPDAFLTVGGRFGRLGSIHAFAGLNDVDPLVQHEAIGRLGVGYGFGDTGHAIRGGLWGPDQAFIGATFSLGRTTLEGMFSPGSEKDLRVGLSHRIGGPPRLQL